MQIPGYILNRPISAGGDFSFYQAIRESDRLPVILKFPTSLRPTSAVTERLKHEFDFSQKLDPLRVARPLSMESHIDTVVLVLEPGPTRTLANLMGTPMDIRSALQIAIGITAALAELHHSELIHKDIKPENILLDDANHVWLTGLGIASRLPRERQAPEPPEIIAGTLAYMAPEQTGRMNRSIDSRSDLYALGVTLYQLFTGELPFRVNDPMEWVHCHIARKPIPPTQRIANFPESLSALVMKLMAKTAEDRYQSTVGLDADLRRCLTQWESAERIDSFPLGEHDIPDHLLIPEKLYGRQSEIETLLAAFARIVANGTPEFILISGYSGIGKTAVVHELHKALVSPRGLFASGKFDQFKRDIPYATLVQALQTIVRQILSKSEAEVATWREAIQQAVSPNGQLIVSLIPEVELIIGKQPPVPDLPPQETQNRFRTVLLHFFSVFAAPEHPLVLFLDDLQWLDAATLVLIEQLATGQDVHHLLLIGAYRDNEVGPTHPLMRIIEAVRKHESGVREIELVPLTIDDVDNLVADALRCDRERAFSLAELVHEKTGGNPFFAIQFLIALTEEKLLAFDPGSGRWTWDLARIHAKGFTDNVVDLMVEKLGRLPEATQEALKQFACLGNAADIATLTTVCEQSEEALHSALWEAVLAGLILLRANTYAFLHDRVQEAAYAIIPENRRKELHLKIGRLLLTQFPQEVLAERIFEVVDQFNRCVELVTDTEERATLRRLNMAAGRKARGAIAYASGRHYLAQAMALLPHNPWDECYAESLAIFQELAECEYLVGNFPCADDLLTAVLAKARTTLDLASIHRLRLRLYQTSGRYREAWEVALKTLQLFGVTFPESDEDIRAATEAEHRLVSDNLRGRRIIDLLDIPPTSDAETSALLSLLPESLPPCLFLCPKVWEFLTAKAVNTCLQRGHSDESSFLYSVYAMALAGDIRNILTAQQFSEMAIELNTQSVGAGHWKGKVLFHHGGFIIVWREHFSTCLPLMDKAFRACLDFGDFVHGGYVTYTAIWLQLENGNHLNDVIEKVRRYVAFAQHNHLYTIYHLDRLEEQFALSLQGKTQSLTNFSDDTFDEAASVAAIEQAGFGLGIAFYYILKQMGAFIGEQYDEALQWAERAAPMLLNVRAHANETTHYFYHALTLAALHAEASTKQQRQFVQTIAEILEKLKLWSDNCPDNFANRYLLVSAELARIEGRDMEAMRLYDRAIRSARDNNFVHQEALAAEITSRFYQTRGFDRIADAYLRDARTGYARWGAQGKVRQLEQRYPHLRELSPLVPTNTSPTAVGEVDSLAVVQASRAISGEIRIDNVIETLMRIVLNTAGARQGYLLLMRDEELSLAAEAHVENQNAIIQVHGEPGIPKDLLPASILNYVRRSQDKVLIDDASSPNPYSEDKYFSHHQTKSVLCFSITKQTTVIGLFYLENDLATHAFTPDRLAVLELLAAQAAITLENAIVYEALRRSEQKFRAIFDQTFQLIGVLSTDGHVLQANQTALQFAGIGENAVIGKLFWETPWWAHSIALQQQLRAAVQEAASGKLVRFEVTHPAANGQIRYIDFSLKPITDAERRVVQIILEGRDITERKQAEEALRLSSERLQLATRVACIGIWDWDVAKNELVWDDSMYQLYGIQREDFSGAYDAWIRTIHPDDKAHTDGEIQAALRGEREYAPEFRIIRPDGSIRYIKADSRTIKDREGKPQRMIGTNIDITEHKRTEEKIRYLNQDLEQRVAKRTAQLEIANKELEAFAYSVSHDLRAPLRHIDGFLDMLNARIGATLDAKSLHYMDTISDSAKRMGTLIDDLLSFSRAARCEMTTTNVDLRALIQEIIQDIAPETQGRSIDWRIGQLPIATGDRAMLRIALVNLISNAVKFTKKREKADIEIGCLPGSDQDVTVFVRDNGAGFDMRYVDKLFGVFQRLHRMEEFEGTGIGLANVHRIISRHGGETWAEGKIDGGATFYFSLPRCGPPQFPSTDHEKTG